MTTIKLTKEQIKLLERGSKFILDTKETKHYYFLPFWFESTEGEDVYIVHSLDNLPEEFKSELIKTHNL